MKNSDKNDPVWALLEKARRVEASPFFSRNVVREVRRLRSEGREGFLAAILAAFRQPALAGAVAASAVLAVVFLSTDPAAPPAVADVPSIEESAFEPADEIGSIEYLGELMAVDDPDELDDAALADLFVLASR